jgi:hypothetical protein
MDHQELLIVLDKNKWLSKSWSDQLNGHNKSHKLRNCTSSDLSFFVAARLTAFLGQNNYEMDANADFALAADFKKGCRDGVRFLLGIMLGGSSEWRKQ